MAEQVIWKCERCGEEFADPEEIIPPNRICSLCSDQAIKYDKDKTRYDLFPPESLEEVGRVFTFGAKKYGDRNWQRGLAWGRLFGAVQRHLWAFWGGEDRDPETNLLHLAHAGWGILALIWHYYNRPDLDDRFKAKTTKKD